MLLRTKNDYNFGASDKRLQAVISTINDRNRGIFEQIVGHTDGAHSAVSQSIDVDSRKAGEYSSDLQAIQLDDSSHSKSRDRS